MGIMLMLQHQYSNSKRDNMEKCNIMHIRTINNTSISMVIFPMNLQFLPPVASEENHRDKWQGCFTGQAPFPSSNQQCFSPTAPPLLLGYIRDKILGGDLVPAG